MGIDKPFYLDNPFASSICKSGHNWGSENWAVCVVEMQVDMNFLKNIFTQFPSPDTHVCSTHHAKHLREETKN
jgi:hypothetical protein